MTSLPSYDELPIDPSFPAGSSWGVWGADDRFGCLNLLTPERITAGMAAVSKGVAFPLNLELHLPDPPLFGRSAFEHKVNSRPTSNDDELSAWNTQSSSQWDGFRHIRHPVHGHYNGLPDEEHGIDHWARRGLVGRAVIADVARWRESVGRPLDASRSEPIEPEDLLSTLAHQGVEVEPGDILLIRTGWVSWYRGLDDAGRKQLAGQLAACGLRPGRATARVLWDLHIAAVAADNPSLEVWPPGVLYEGDWRADLAADADRAAPEGFMHFALLPLLGLPIGELWDLDALAEDCAADGTYTCLLTSSPLYLRAGVASPPNAIALR